MLHQFLSCGNDTYWKCVPDFALLEYLFFFIYVWFIKTAQTMLLFTGNTRKIHIIILIFMYLSHQFNHWRNWLSVKFEAALGTKYSRLWSWKKGPSHWQVSSYLCVNLTTDFSCHLLVNSTKSHHASCWFALWMT